MTQAERDAHDLTLYRICRDLTAVDKAELREIFLRWVLLLSPDCDDKVDATPRKRKAKQSKKDKPGLDGDGQFNGAKK